MFALFVMYNERDRGGRKNSNTLTFNIFPNSAQGQETEKTETSQIKAGMIMMMIILN